MEGKYLRDHRCNPTKMTKLSEIMHRSRSRTARTTCLSQSPVGRVRYDSLLSQPAVVPSIMIIKARCCAWLPMAACRVKILLVSLCIVKSKANASRPGFPICLCLTLPHVKPKGRKTHQSSQTTQSSRCVFPPSKPDGNQMMSSLPATTDSETHGETV